MTVSHPVRRVAVFGVAALLLALLPMTPAAAAAPSVTITSPAAGTVAPGTVSITAQGLTDSLVELPTTIELLIDVVNPVTALPPADPLFTFTCPSATPCNASFSWVAPTSSPFNHTIAVRMRTNNVSTVVTDQVAVSVGSLPNVGITAPAPGASVSGLVPVHVTATTDTGLTEFPQSIELLDGAASVGVLPCPATTNPCSVTFDWDVTGLASAGHVLKARVTTDALRTAASSIVSVTVANPGGAVVITSPAGGATVLGLTSVAVSASTDTSLSDYPASIAVRDGSRVIGSLTCAPPVHACIGTVSWDTTGLSGTHTLSADLVTTRSVTVTSAPVAVTVDNPTPTVAIWSPDADAAVSGTVSVRATGSTDVRRSDLPATFSLLVDGVVQTSVPCTGGAHDCTVVLPWSASHAAGAHTLVVTMTTTAGLTASSPSRVLYASSGSRVLLALPKIVRSGAPVLVVGRVVATTTGLGVAGVAVTVTRRPALGAASTIHVVSGADGVFTLRYVARTNATVTAVVIRTAWLSTSLRVTSIRAMAPMSCTVATRTLAVGAVGRGRCAVVGLPAGTGLSLRYTFRGRLSTLASGRAKGPAIPFAFGFPARGVYLLRIDLLANRVYVATMSSVLRVVVR